MARNRSIRFRGKRGRKEPFEVDITSLLDILVILLVFLLRSYNDSGIIINIPKEITIPKSESQSVNSAGVMIQVSGQKIWVDDEEVLDSATVTGRVYDQGGLRILPLYNTLVKKKETINNISTQAIGEKKFSGIANLIIDKSLKYSYLKKLMYTCAEAGFKEYKFIVLGNE
jgi:biopolymer transport protein ExbD